MGKAHVQKGVTRPQTTGAGSQRAMEEYHEQDATTTLAAASRNLKMMPARKKCTSPSEPALQGRHMTRLLGESSETRALMPRNPV